MDIEKIRREQSRWIILRTLDNGRPSYVADALILAVLQDVYRDSPPSEIDMRRNLDYLRDRGLVKIDEHPDGRWTAELTRYGVDIVEYTIDCEPGIARPPR